MNTADKLMELAQTWVAAELKDPGGNAAFTACSDLRQALIAVLQVADRPVELKDCNICGGRVDLTNAKQPIDFTMQGRSRPKSGDRPVEKIGVNIERLLNAGNALANIGFNLAQKPGHLLQDDHCLSLDAARREWDMARIAYAKSIEAAAQVQPVAEVKALHIPATGETAKMAYLMDKSLPGGTLLYAAPPPALRPLNDADIDAITDAQNKYVAATHAYVCAVLAAAQPKEQP